MLNSFNRQKSAPLAPASTSRLTDYKLSHLFTHHHPMLSAPEHLPVVITVGQRGQGVFAMGSHATNAPTS